MDKKCWCAAVHQVAKNCTWLERKWKQKSLSHVQLFATPWPIQSMEFSRPKYWSDLSLLQGIVPSPGLNPGLPHCRWILCHLSHNGNPKIMEWVAYPFSSGYSWLRNQTGVSCLTGGFFTNWAIREARTWLSDWVIATCIFESVYVSMFLYWKKDNILSVYLGIC